MNRILALDVGDKRVGVALTDPLKIIASPHSSIDRDKESAYLKVLKLAQEYQCELIIVGMPVELSGEVGNQAKKTKNFIKKLNKAFRENNFECEVKTWDERFSSVEADRALIGSKLLNKERAKARDRASASLILQSYLEFTKNDVPL